jgi:single-strand DNA-binding protein
MTQSINKIILIGRVGAEVDLKMTTSGDSVATINLATSESWKDKVSGEKKEQTMWHRIIFYKKLADLAYTYLKKGSLCYIEGSLKYRKYKDKNNEEKSISEILCNEFKILSSKSQNNELILDDQEKLAMKPSIIVNDNNSNFDDDIPF